MKTLYLFFCLLISIFCFSQKTELVTKVVYKFIYKHSDNPKYTDFHSKLNSEFEQIRLNLVFNNEKGAYYFIKDESKRNNQYYGLATSFVFRNYTYNFINNTSTVYKQWLGNNYYYTLSLTDIDWTLLKDKKKINNLECFKAVTIIKEKKTNEFGKIYIKETPIIAWYTPSIKCIAGPEGFNGLPGVIIELYNGYGTYIAENINFNFSIDTSVIHGPLNYQKLTKKEFDEITSETMNMIIKHNKK